MKTLRALESTLMMSSSGNSRHKSSATFAGESSTTLASEVAAEAGAVPAALLVASA